MSHSWSNEKRHHCQDLQILEDKEEIMSQALVAHAYNPSYSGGRDQKDYGGQNSSWDPISKKKKKKKENLHKKGLVEWLKV
jgi:hypothetical protein